MDTTPFHLMLFALDVVVLGGLFLWIRFRRNTGLAHAAVYQFEKSLYAPIRSQHPSFFWDMTGVALFGGFGFVCFAVLSRFIFTNFAQKHIYHFNVGQCIAEGIAIHGTLFFIVTASLLFWNRRKWCAVFFGCCAVVLAGVSFNCLYWEPYNLKVEYYKIETAKVKKPLRIVFVSDIQTDRISSHEINTLKKIQQQKADLIIFGGDYIQTFLHKREKHLPEKFRQMLIDYPLEAPLGVYAIAGNISDSKVRDADLFKETSVEFFHDTVIFDDLGVEEDLGPIDLVLLKLGDSWGNVGKRGLTDSDNFIVMAGHCPNYAIDGWTNPKNGRSLSGYRNAERAPDLMLAGHTHGGQIVIPFYGPVPFGGDGRVKQIPRHMRGGFFTYPNGGHLLVTRGSGVERGWAPRIRLFCPAEISVIDIVPGVPAQ
jgi:predicted MPP superfamily phosphohydrolase